MYPKSTWISTDVCMVCENFVKPDELMSLTVPAPPHEKFTTRPSFILFCSSNPKCCRMARKILRIHMENRFYINDFEKWFSFETEYLIPRSDGTKVPAKIIDQQLVLLNGKVHLWFNFEKNMNKGVPIDVVMKENPGISLTIYEAKEFQEDCPEMFATIEAYFQSLKKI